MKHTTCNIGYAICNDVGLYKITHIKIGAPRPTQHDIAYHDISDTYHMRHSMHIAKQYIICDIPYFRIFGKVFRKILNTSLKNVVSFLENFKKYFEKY